ncbi:CBL-interacting protein kinase 32, partial [Linum perenne]
MLKWVLHLTFLCLSLQCQLQHWPLCQHKKSLKVDSSNMKLIKHPNVVNIYEVMASRSKIYIVFVRMRCVALVTCYLGRICYFGYYNVVLVLVVGTLFVFGVGYELVISV